MKHWIRNHAKAVKLGIASLFVLAAATSTTAHALTQSGSVVYSCATYGSYFCCQPFVYTRFGWVEAGDAGWYSTANF